MIRFDDDLEPEILPSEANKETTTEQTTTTTTTTKPLISFDDDDDDNDDDNYNDTNENSAAAVVVYETLPSNDAMERERRGRSLSRVAAQATSELFADVTRGEASEQAPPTDSILDELDLFFADVQAVPSGSAAAVRGPVARELKFTELHVLADELRRTLQLREVIVHGTGEMESIAQMLVSSLWSFASEVLTFSSKCNDGNDVTVQRRVRVAQLDAGRVAALRCQLRALAHVHQRSLFLCACELAYAELRLAFAVHRIDLATLNNENRLQLLECLFEVLSSTDGVGSAASVRAASVVHELVAAVAASGGEGCVAPAYAIASLNRCGGGEWGAAWLLRCEPAQVWREQLLMATFAGLADNQVWPAAHYVALLSRIDWHAVCAQVPLDETVHVVEPAALALGALAARGGYESVTMILTHVLVLLTRKYPVLLERAFDALTTSPWPCAALAMPFLALLPWAHGSTRMLRGAFARLYGLNGGGDAVRAWSELDAASRDKHRRQLVKQLEAHADWARVVYARVPGVALALNFHVDSGAPAAAQSAQTRGDNRCLGLLPLLRVLGALAEADLAAAAATEGRRGSLATCIVDELVHFAFVYGEQGSLLWVLRNESFFELSRLVDVQPAFMDRLLAAGVRELPAIEESGVAAFVKFNRDTLLARWDPSHQTVDCLGWMLSHRRLNSARASVDEMVNQCVNGNVHAGFTPVQAHKGFVIASHVVDAIAWARVSERRVRFDLFCVLSASAHSAGAWTMAALARADIGGALVRDLPDYWCQLMLSAQNERRGTRVAQCTMVLALAAHRDDRREALTWLEEWGIWTRLDQIVQWGYDMAVLSLLERVLPFALSEPARVAERVRLWLHPIALRDPSAVEHLVRQTLWQGDDGARPQWHVLWQTVLAGVPLNDGNARLLALLDALLYESLKAGVSCDVALVGLTRATTSFTPGQLSRLVKQQLPWIAVTLARDAALHAQEARESAWAAAQRAGNNSASGASGGGGGAASSVKSKGKWMAMRAAAKLRSSAAGKNNALLAARAAALACDGDVNDAAGLCLWDAFFRIFFSTPADADVVPASEKRSLQERHAKLAESAARRGLDSVRDAYRAFATWSCGAIFQGHKSILQTHNGALLQGMRAGSVLSNELVTPPPVLADEAADERARAAPRARKAIAMPALSAVASPALETLAALPAVRAGRRMHVRVEALLDEARSATVQRGEAAPMLSLAERFRSLADERASQRLLLTDLDEGFVETLEQLYDNRKVTQDVMQKCAASRGCRGAARLRLEMYEAVGGDGAEQMRANRRQAGQQLGALSRCSQHFAAAMLAMDVAVELLLDVEDVRAARSLFFSMMEHVVLADVVPPDSPILAALVKALLRLGKLLRASSDGSVAAMAEHERHLLEALMRASARVDGDIELPSESRSSRLVFGESRGDLLTLFAPRRVLESGRDQWDVYFELLRELSGSSTELGDNEVALLAARFDVAETLPRVLRNEGERREQMVLALAQELLRRPALAQTGVCMLEQLLVVAFARQVQPVLGTLLRACASDELAPCAWHRAFPSDAMAALEPQVIQQLAGLLCEHMPLPDRHARSAVQLMRVLLLGTRLQQHLHQPAVWLYIAKLFDACLRERDDGAALSERNFERALSLLADVTRAAPSTIDCVWPLLSSRVIPRLARGWTHDAADSTREWATACLTLLQRLPWESATFHVASAESVQLTLLAARAEPLAARVLATGLEWSACKQWLTRGSASFSGKVAASLLFFVMQLTFAERSLIQPGLAALVELGDAWNDVDADQFAAIVDDKCLRTLMIESVGEPSDALLACAKRLSQIGCVAPPLHDACASAIRGALFVVLEHHNGARWHLPLHVHEAVVRDALVPLAGHGSSERSGGVRALLSCARGRTLEAQHCKTLAYATTAAVAAAAAAAAAATASDANEHERSDMALAGDAPLWLAARDIAAPGVRSFERRLEATLTGFCASAAIGACVQVLRVGGGACRDVNELVRLFEAALHGYFAQAGDADADGGDGVCAVARAVRSLDDIGRAVCESRLAASGAGECALTLRLLLEWLRLRPNAAWRDIASLVRVVCAFEPSVHHRFDVLALWFFVIDRVADKRWLANDGGVHDELLALFYRNLQWYSGVAIASGGSALRARLDATRAKFSGRLTPRMRLAAVACHAFCAKVLLARARSSKGGARGGGGGGGDNNNESDVPAIVDGSASEAASAALSSMEQTVQQALNQLDSWRTNASFKGFERFFDSIAAPLHAQPLDAGAFQVVLAQTLVPIAPYLEQLVWRDDDDA